AKVVMSPQVCCLRSSHHIKSAQRHTRPVSSRRKGTEANRITETVGCSLWKSGRRAFCTQRSKIVRTYGAFRSDNAGMSNEKRVRLSFTESPRIPEEGSSAQG